MSCAVSRAGCCAETVHTSTTAALQRPRQRQALLVVDVDDRGLQPGPAEQLLLGFPVGLHRAVVVEVVLREVGEDRHADARAVQPALHDADGRGFDGTGLQAVVQEGAELPLQQHRVGRGEADEFHIGRAAGSQRADDAARQRAVAAHTGQRLRQPPRGRRLAVGARDGEHLQGARRLVEVRGGDRPRGRLQLRVGGDRVRVEAERLDALMLDQASRRAARDGRRHVRAPVRRRAGPGDEAVARAPPCGCRNAACP